MSSYDDVAAVYRRNNLRLEKAESWAGEIKGALDRLDEHLETRTGHLQTGARIRAHQAKKAKPMKLIIPYEGYYSSPACAAYPNLIWVFGDNLIRVGLGGQATIRSCQNALGVATKRLPGGKDEFFEEGCVSDMGQMCHDLVQVEGHLARGDQVIIPITAEGRISLGCGLANLPYHAPTAYAFLEKWFERMKAKHGTASLP